MLKTIISIIILALSYPTALVLKRITKNEIQIYEKYFKIALWPLAILAAIFYTLNTEIALTLTFLFLLIFFWNKK